jgi:tetratricopeptide (TPR) repeat protein
VNTNLLKVIRQITADYGEEVLDAPRRLKAFFSDLAKDEPKPLRMAFGKCVESGFYRILKDTVTPEERREVIESLARRLRDEEGLDIALCAEALELLAAAIFGTTDAGAVPVCAGCGAELKANSKFCPECGTPVQGAASAPAAAPPPVMRETPAEPPAPDAPAASPPPVMHETPAEPSPAEHAAVRLQLLQPALWQKKHTLRNVLIVAGVVVAAVLIIGKMNTKAKVDSWFNQGKEYHLKGDFDQTISAFTEALRIDPNLAYVYASRGDAYRMKGQYDAAINDYDAAIRLEPNYAWAYASRGVAYNQKAKRTRPSRIWKRR